MALGSGEQFPSSSHAVDADGRVIVSVAGSGSGASTTVTTKQDQVGTGVNVASWTSGTALNTSLDAPVTNEGTITVEANVPGTITDGVVTFYASADGGTNFYPVDAVRLSGVIAEAFYSLAGGSQLWVLSADGLTHVRVRLTTVIAGSGTVTVRTVPFGGVIEPNVAAIPSPGRVATFGVQTGDIAGSTAVQDTYFLTGFKPAAIRRDVQILRIEYTARVVAVGGDANARFRLLFISAENGTPGGTAKTAQPTNMARAASGVTWRVLPAVPTTTGNIIAQWPAGLGPVGTPLVLYSFDRLSGEEPIILRGGVAEGVMFQQQSTGGTLTTAPSGWVNIIYKEMF